MHKEHAGQCGLKANDSHNTASWNFEANGTTSLRRGN